MELKRNGLTIATINLTLSSPYSIEELKTILRDKENLKLEGADEQTKDAIRILGVLCLYGLTK